MDGSRKVYAGLHYGLHSFNLPWLAERQRLKQGIMLALLLTGFLFSLTGAVLGWRGLRRAI